MPPNVGQWAVEVIGTGGERIHPRSNKGDRSLLKTPQGSSEQYYRGEGLFQEVVGRGYFQGVR